MPTGSATRRRGGGYPDEVLAPRGVLTPGTPILAKPFTAAALASAVRSVCEHA